nr:MAG TPA: PROTEIN/DNA Complex catalytic motif, Helix-turn-helix DNA [Caudoviricetes sp.]
MSEACRQLDLDPSTVVKILKGTRKSTRGYTFKYKEDK